MPEWALRLSERMARTENEKHSSAISDIRRYKSSNGNHKHSGDCKPDT